VTCLTCNAFNIMLLLCLFFLGLRTIDLSVDLTRLEGVERRAYLTSLESYLTRQQAVVKQGKVELLLRVIELYKVNPLEEVLRRLSQLHKSHAKEMRGLVERFLREPMGEESEMPLTLANLSLFLVAEDETLFHNLIPVERRRLRKLLERYHAVVEWGVEKRAILTELVGRVREAVSIRSAMKKFSKTPTSELLWRIERLTPDPILLKRLADYRHATTTLEKDQLMKEIVRLWKHSG